MRGHYDCHQELQAVYYVNCALLFFAPNSTMHAKLRSLRWIFTYSAASFLMFHLERTTYRLNGFLLVTEDDFSHIYCHPL